MTKNIHTPLLLTIAAIIVAAISLIFYTTKSKPLTIKVGILHSQTGPFAISEIGIIDSVMLAIQEINNEGGLLGALIEPIIRNGASNPEVFAKEAEVLITQDKVQVIFGCWSSSSRKAVQTVVEKYNNLLIFPVPYEGLEISPNILHTGTCPNQNVIPSLRWSIKNKGNKFFIVGSDYVFSRAVSEIIKDYAKILGATIVGEEYEPLDSANFTTIVTQIKQTKPDIILNTISGASNVAFFKQLFNAGITAQEIPCVSYTIGEHELKSLPLQAMIGHYCCWTYFESLSNPRNYEFVKKFKNAFGSYRSINDPMETAYFSVYLWALSVKQAHTAQTDAVRTALKIQGYNAPEGIVSVDGPTFHTWCISRIGEITKDGQFNLIWEARKPVRPIPFPPTRSQKEWLQFLENLKTKWNGHWEYRRPLDEKK